MKYIVGVEFVNKADVVNPDHPFDGDKVHHTETKTGIDFGSYAEVESHAHASLKEACKNAGMLYRIVKIELL